ncbi:hypothetical protein LUZ60_015791 [Juncus effusus]|nr:hypothetical protein LUZ60_015791 [Juncus effusus]
MGTARDQLLLSLLFLLPCLFLFHFGQPLMPVEQKSSNGESVSPAVTKDERSTESTAEENQEFVGNFPTLDSMLQWAIGNSDPEKLKEKAEIFQKFSPEELLKRQVELKELMEMITMPSDSEVMKILIANLNNSSASQQERQNALNNLLNLIEQTDDPLDLDKMGVLEPVINELENSETEIRTISALILGKVSQNDALVQNQILAYGAMTRLMKMVKSSYKEEAIKALYTISALLQNNENGQEIFYSQGGNLLIQDLIKDSSRNVRLQKKAVVLLTDLADFQMTKNSKDTNENKFVIPFLSEKSFLKSLINLLSNSDLDLQEKVLMGIRSLLKLDSTVNFEELSSLDQVLERMKIQLEIIASDEDQLDYVRDVEILRKEVQTVFRQKLELVQVTPS